MNKNSLEFECTGIKDEGKFPVENTGRGKDISPEFMIKDLAPDAKSFIIALEKDIPSGKTILSPEGAVQGRSRQKANPIDTVLRFMYWIANSDCLQREETGGNIRGIIILLTKQKDFTVHTN